MSSSVGKLLSFTNRSIVLLLVMVMVIGTVTVSAQIESPSPSPFSYLVEEPSSAPTEEPFSAPTEEPFSGPSSYVFEEPSSAPTAVDCFTSLLNLSDCLSYVESESNLTVPEKACCPELAGLLDSNPVCLCDLLGKDETYGIKIDMNKALMLPSVCKVATPPVSACSGYPVGSPTEAPEGMPPGGFASSPTPANGESASSSIIISFQALIAALALAFLPTFF